MATKTERTKPGSKLDWRVTYDTGSKKWTNDKPGDGKGDTDEQENLFDDLTVKRGIDRLERAISAFAGGTGGRDGIISAVKNLESHAGKDSARTAVRAVYKAVDGKDAGGKATEGAKIAKDFVNRDRKTAMSREEKIAMDIIAKNPVFDVFMKEMDKVGKRSKGKNGDDLWTLRDGSSVSGFFNDHRVTFHVERIFIPAGLRKRGISKKILKKIGEAADKAEIKLTAIVLADKEVRPGFEKKWMETVKKHGGFTIDIDQLDEALEDMTREEILEEDRQSPGLWEDVIRHPRKAFMDIPRMLVKMAKELLEEG